MNGGCNGITHLGVNCADVGVGASRPGIVGIGSSGGSVLITGNDTGGLWLGPGVGMSFKESEAITIGACEDDSPDDEVMDALSP